MVDKLPEEAFAPFVEALTRSDTPIDITAPALAVYAVGDQWHPAEAAWRVACRDRFVAETAHGRVIEMRASHYVFLDRRDDVLAAIREFLS